MHFDVVVLGSTWDYSDRREDFLAWSDHVSQASTLANPTEMIRWTTGWL